MRPALCTIGPQETRALKALAAYYHGSGYCVFFREISRKSKLTKHQTRRAIRSLARKGLAEYHRGLFDDDGKVCGSGYCCTVAGIELFREMQAP